jgi:hypothetical protein
MGVNGVALVVCSQFGGENTWVEGEGDWSQEESLTIALEQIEKNIAVPLL